MNWESVVFSRGVVKSYPRSLSFAHDNKGGTWIAWESFMADQRVDRILARYWDGKELSKPYTICTAPTCCMPQVTTDLSGRPWVFWASGKENGWKIYTRIFDGHKWRKATKITSSGNNLHPSVGTDSRGRIWIVWECHNLAGSLVKAKTYTNRSGSPETIVSRSLGENFRPKICTGNNGEVYVVWDSYKENTYNIFARSQVDEQWSDIQQVSTDAQWELMPCVAVDNLNRLWTAWLCSTDVTNDNGVIDQWPTIRCAIYDCERWRQITEEDGTIDLAFLGHGLLPKVSPKTAVWGYLGRRRQPMLVADGQGGVWLLWERKEKHDGNTTTTEGLLCGRQLDEEECSKTVVLKSGQVFYITSNNPPMTGGKIQMCAKTGKHKETRFGSGVSEPKRICLWFTDMPRYEECEQLQSEEWSGWIPVRLSGEKERMDYDHDVDVEDTSYRLYWGDPHCHCRLSADAEGEVDEILHYARDKAGLDFCVITDNDFYCLPMSSSEWALNQHYTRKFDASGRFVLFSGYEWSARNPLNHRSIVYLTSDQPILRWTDPGSRNIEEMRETIEKTNGIMHAHHQTWSLSDSPRECNVEVCSGWGIYIDKPECIHRHLADGHIFGFVGGSDSHRRNPGLCGALTGVFAKELTRESIFSALQKRRCYATNGSRIFLDFRINGTFMGGECEIKGNPEIRVRAIGARRLVLAELFRNGRVVHSVKGFEKELLFMHVDKNCPPGKSYYYVRVTQEGETPVYPSNIAVAKGNRAWSSPIWVTK